MVWRDVLPFVPVALRPAWERRNDLVAVAASARGSLEPHRAESGPLRVPLLCYVGTGEWFWEVAQAMTTGADATFVPLEGADHSAAFQHVDTVTAAVRPFLKRHV
jgi:hypothetical protein